MTPIARAQQEIEIILDTAASAAAAVFLAAARRQLAPFNLKRHRVQLEFDDIAIHENRADGRARTAWWFEHPKSPARDALETIYEAFANLPGNVRKHLATTTL